MTTSMYKGTAKDAGEQHSTSFDTMLSIVTNKRALEALQQRHDWEMEKQRENDKAAMDRTNVAGEYGLKQQGMQIAAADSSRMELTAVAKATDLMKDDKFLRELKRDWVSRGRSWDPNLATQELAAMFYQQLISLRGTTINSAPAALASGGIPPPPEAVAPSSVTPPQIPSASLGNLSASKPSGLDWQSGRQMGGGGKVSMVAPDGRRLSVPRSDVKKLIAAGAKLVG